MLKRIALLLGVFGVGWVLTGGGPLAPRHTPRQLCMTALDVGQGDAQLLQLPGGESWLVDGGGSHSGGDVGRYRVLPELRRAGIDRLERVLVSHGDADHAAGLISVVEAVEVGELWLPTRERMVGTMRALVRAAQRRGVVIRAADEGSALAAPPSLDVDVLHPWPGWADGLHVRPSENDRSLVVRIALGRVSFLLTGDVEHDAEERLVAARRAPRSTVMKVPHHASRTSSTPAFVDAVDPLVAVAGIAEENSFGFPHASVARRYLLRQAPLYWTGRHGALRLCTDGWSLRVDQQTSPGRWAELRSWTEQEVATWHGQARDDSPPAPPQCVAAPPCSPRRQGRSRSSRRSASRAKKAPKPKKVPKPKKPPKIDPVDHPDLPVLLDDKEWERHRSRRGRL